MRYLQTATELVNLATIIRIAYLNPDERRFLTEKTGRPDNGPAGQGEIIADIGAIVPLTLGYTDDVEEGALIVAYLTGEIARGDAAPGNEIIAFSDVQEGIRRRLHPVGGLEIHIADFQKDVTFEAQERSRGEQVG
jgi:hypothetical protein